MPRPASDQPLVAVRINIYESDDNALAELFPSVSRSLLIRRWVHACVTARQAELAGKPKLKVDLEDLCR